jgi:hypothetical protein
MLTVLGLSIFVAAAGFAQMPTAPKSPAEPKPKTPSTPRPDLVPVKALDAGGMGGYCNLASDNDSLRVTVRNQGKASAPVSVTTVVFTPGGPIAHKTPALAAGASTNFTVQIPKACFNPDCRFRITVDSEKTVTESNEGNNSANGICVG